MATTSSMPVSALDVLVRSYAMQQIRNEGVPYPIPESIVEAKVPYTITGLIEGYRRQEDLALREASEAYTRGWESYKIWEAIRYMTRIDDLRILRRAKGYPKPSGLPSNHYGLIWMLDSDEAEPVDFVNQPWAQSSSGPMTSIDDVIAYLDDVDRPQGFKPWVKRPDGLIMDEAEVMALRSA